ncbi:hypothetical protein Q9L58_009269 [Maublancomyces gigas]|uniref:Uncharacterized protein n=1 Tax=Discina gigas TaxID=1032678 RepID=A0ABR3G8E8_9PEZI
MSLHHRISTISQFAWGLPRLTAPIRYLHQRVRPSLTKSDFDTAHSRVYHLHASVAAHNSGYAAIIHALEINPGVIPHEKFLCGFRSARAGPDINVDGARLVKEKLGNMEVWLAGELLTLREYEREWHSGIVLGRMRMSDGELNHVVAYIRSWADYGGRAREVEEVLEEAAWWLVFEVVPIEEWEVVKRVGGGSGGAEAEREGVGGVLRTPEGGRESGEPEGGLRRRHVRVR